MQPLPVNLRFSIFILHFAFCILLLLPLPPRPRCNCPNSNAAEPIAISAQAGNQWQLGAYEVWVLRGDCVIQQGKATPAAARPSCGSTARTPPSSDRHKVIAYLEGDVEVVLDAGPTQRG